MARPLGVTLIAAYEAFSGVVRLVLGLGLVAAGSLAAKLAGMVPEYNIFSRFLSGMGKVFGIAVILTALLHLSAGFGLWSMKAWGRSLTLLLAVLGMLLFLPTLVHPHPLGFGAMVINGLIVIYLLMSGVKSSFGA